MSEFTMYKRELIFNKTKGFCIYCGVEITLDNFHMEHMKPKSAGGKNEITNLFPTCAICNIHKGPLTVEEFRKKIEKMPTKTTGLRMFCQFYNVKPKKIKFYFEKNKLYPVTVKPWL